VAVFFFVFLWRNCVHNWHVTSYFLDLEKKNEPDFGAVFCKIFALYNEVWELLFFHAFNLDPIAVNDIEAPFKFENKFCTPFLGLILFLQS